MATIVSILIQQNTHTTNPSPRRRPAPLLRTRRRRPEKKTVLPRVVHLLAAAPHAVVLESLLVREIAECRFTLLFPLLAGSVDRGVGDGGGEAARRGPAKVVRWPARVCECWCSAGHDRCGCESRPDGAPRHGFECAAAAGEQNCCQHSAAMPCVAVASSVPPPSARRAAAGLREQHCGRGLYAATRRAPAQYLQQQREQMRLRNDCNGTDSP